MTAIQTFFLQGSVSTLLSSQSSVTSCRKVSVKFTVSCCSATSPLTVVNGNVEKRPSDRTEVRIGLPSKGRMAADSLDLLKDCQLSVRQVNPRQYVAEIPQIPNLEVWFQRPKDIVRKLVAGDLDLGIVGLDTVCEYGQIYHTMTGTQVGDVASSSTTSRLDFSSPFYLHPSENAGSSLLPGVFDGTGYRSWRRAVLRALSVKSKTGFINGTIVKPTSTDPNFMQWERCDDMVTSWILNSLSPELRDSLQYVNNARELWAELEERYDQTNGCKLYQLQKEINELVQGTLDITKYYTTMKKLWEEMSTVDINSQCTCVCSCGGKTKLQKAEQDRRLIHFLMGLNEMYTTVRGSILMMNTLPSMAQAFAILCQEEKQREVKPHNHTALDSTSLNAYGQYNNNAGYKGFKTDYSSSKGAGSSSGNNMSRGNSSINRSLLVCDYCKKSGHTRDRCYKLHGYPSNPKFQKGKRTSTAANVCASDMSEQQSEEEPQMGKQMPISLSKDQYEQLLNILGNIQAGNGGFNSDNSNNMMNGAVNLAGPFSEEPSGAW